MCWLVPSAQTTPVVVGAYPLPTLSVPLTSALSLPHAVYSLVEQYDEQSTNAISETITERGGHWWVPSCYLWHYLDCRRSLTGVSRWILNISSFDWEVQWHCTSLTICFTAWWFRAHKINFPLCFSISVESAIHQCFYILQNDAVACSNFRANDSIRSKNKDAKLVIKGVMGTCCKHDVPWNLTNLYHGERLVKYVLIDQR